MAIDWDKTTKEDMGLIHKCAIRANNLLISLHGGKGDLLSISMDIEAGHINCPLKLADLLEADEFNFMHDVLGISKHLNRETGELEGYFLPRFAA